MSQTIQGNPKAWIESIARSLPPASAEDFRNFGQLLVDNLTYVLPGGNFIKPGGSVSGSSAPPAGVTHTVSGANGVATVNVTNPPSAKPQTIYHQVRYSPLVSFTSNVTESEPTTATSITIPQSGVSAFYQLRSSFDKISWSDYQFPTSGPVAVDAGLVESSAMSMGGAFNQSNFAEVNSAADGSSVQITVAGTGGANTPYTATRGTTQALRPSATIAGVTPQTEQFVGFDGTQYYAKNTLAGVLDDGLEPVGKVSTVSTTPPTPPTIVPVISGGQIVGYNVTGGGNGASEPYTLTLGSVGSGTGATFGAQNIIGGVLISVAPGNPGANYAGSTTVIVSGGSGTATGGGQALGGNGARMTAV